MRLFKKQNGFHGLTSNSQLEYDFFNYGIVNLLNRYFIFAALFWNWIGIGIRNGT